MPTRTRTARVSFAAEVDGRTVVVLEGARFPATAAVVKTHGSMFTATRPRRKHEAAKK